ncbi:Myb domain [Arabidopsis thaliana x Arabidopsis arenosa]|uniref:Myb domain n=1 Tax=Arabidopsis thaliana x Arabidopsis arenosa TaxID=1240361 RepID=A0A8T2BXW2_9BRAS|nr:Myb domain [Arabidopsis thaliana x Arabidopsis arenosa]KAG7592217.1 Myb domain [Arabidopsis thaliana x Arabidopsis arenosa]
MAAVSCSSETGDCGATGKRDEIMLFGVRVVVDPMRKCVSLNNLSDYEKSSPEDEIPKIVVAAGAGDGEDKNEADATVIVADGYASANDAVQISSSSGGRKRGVPWTENEHKRFLIGLQKVGKGDWKGISRNFVKSRTPTQVASHAQKYFLRRTNLNRRRRRSSLFDITTETVTEMPMEQDPTQENSPLPETNTSSGHQVMQVFPEVAVPTKTENAPQTFHLNDPYLVPVTFQAKPAFNLNTDAAPLSLNLSLASSFNLNEQPNSRHSAFAMMPSFSDGDSNSSIIRVA